ncbi:hypothetical protein E2562_003407 [Oryza meyeriana var. granulata]|uniref:Uncharacterized protein n=1 Tax=Oryza meyeriana var. granulata TaxID=110450 RepID=A0A6G1EF30_9ORYZ|nr:hypothetical protein E2562_003407 [Oryza meyeriana var. granulata]
MFRRAAMGAAPPASDSEVRVQKVDKLDLVFNILTTPTVYGPGKGSSNPPMAGAARRPAAAGDHGGVAGRNLGPTGAGGGNTSRGIDDINKRSENYIRDRKRMFFGQT